MTLLVGAIVIAAFNLVFAMARNDPLGVWISLVSIVVGTILLVVVELPQRGR